MTRAEWEQSVLAPARAKASERANTDPVPAPVDLVSTPDDVADIEYARDIADPGEFPFTRGAHSTGYQDRPWTTRQSAAFGTPLEANARYRHLLASGATGLSLEFDPPTLMGRDPDHPLSAGAVGHRGVSVASVDDMLDLFAGVDLGTVPVTMVINGPAPVMFALFLVAAERRGVAWPALSGTVQHDVLSRSIFPSRPTMRLMTDVIAFCQTHVPRWSPVSVSGCELREAGATAQQELSFTVCYAMACVSHSIDAGLDVEDVGPGLSLALSAHGDFFGDIARYRAARQVWARVMRERFGARTDRACALRLHTQTSRASLAGHEPSNAVRTTFQAMAAVLGGTDSLHTRAFDDAVNLPTAEAATLALRTQQVLASECGLTGAVDPLGGSWWVERLTRDFVARTFSDIDAIDSMGGMVAAVEQGVPQRQVADAARRTRMDRGRPEDKLAVDIDDVPAVRQSARACTVRQQRDARAVAASLGLLRQSASGSGNTMELFIECARAGATLGDMCDVLRTEWGESVESPASEAGGASAR
jgi:methylmalonyl-CoA mutase N-terminal domain/subunit